MGESPNRLKLLKTRSQKEVVIPPAGSTNGTGHAHPPKAENTARLVSRSLAEIEKRDIDWLWPGRIPFGMFSMLDGDPTQGKSLITLDIAARLSLGKSMPCCESTRIDPGNVLIIAAEDAVEQIIKPRCIVAGCDEQRIRVSETIRIGKDERPIRLPDDFDLLKREIQEQSIQLVIIDPLLGFISQAIDSHKEQSIRDVLHKIKIIADATKAAFLGLRHLNKGGSGNALYRGMGSIAITAAARSALTVDKHPSEDGTFVLATTKCNLVKMPRSIKYRITDTAGYATVSWGVECDITANDLGAKFSSGGNGAADDAAEFLADILKAGGLLEAEVKKLAENAGIKERTLYRAKKTLRIRSVKTGYGPATWEWRLPGASDDSCQPIPD
jgi:hypothetical protein